MVNQLYFCRRHAPFVASTYKQKSDCSARVRSSGQVKRAWLSEKTLDELEVARDITVRKRITKM